MFMFVDNKHSGIQQVNQLFYLHYKRQEGQTINEF